MKRSVSNIFFVMSYMIKYTPLYFFSGILNEMVRGAQMFIEFSFASKFILDAMEYGRPFKDVLLFMAVFFSLTTLRNFWQSFNNKILQPKGQEKLKMMVNAELYKKAAALDLSCYDTPSFYNDFVWSVSEANKKMEEVYDKILELSTSVTIVILSGVMFVFLDWIGLIFVAVTLVLSMIIGKISNKMVFNKDTDLLPKIRKRDYIGRVFYLSDFAKEIRLFGIAPKLKKDFSKTNQEIESTLNRYNGKIAVLQFVENFVLSTFVFQGLYLIYLMFLKIVRSAISFGDMVALFNAARWLRWRINNISGIIPSLYADSLYIERIRKFLEYEPKITGEGKELSACPLIIEFRNVTFAYNEEPVLKNVSLTIHPGEKIAVVGYNGAGKTTFVKLLMRLYDPTEGEILLGGINIKEYNLSDYRKKIGTIFQDYQIFAAPIYDNVVMNTSEGLDHDVKNALIQSGFNNQLPIYSPLTREFDDAGVNLSGGEAQKIAIARTFFKSADYLIFDEPSSALDPISEYNIYNAMRKASAGKTVIFISHRLASTKMADKIYMFDSGQIAEAADHETLMAQNGKYAEMFNLQASKYQFTMI